MMTRQYVQRSNQSARESADSRILQRTAVRSIPVTTPQVQTEPEAEDKPRLKQDWTQIPVRNHEQPEGDRMAIRKVQNIAETVGRSPLSPAQLSYSVPVQPIQAKLTIGQPNDLYEQEADRIAAEVASRLNGPNSDASPESQTSERREAAPPFQTKTAPSPIQTQEGGAISPELEASIQQAKGGGSPLPKPLRTKMERAFGRDNLGEVKIHTGIESDRLNRSIQARAFTSGRDIFFRQGEYRPESKESQQLIAHELVHVQQQNPDRIQRALEEEELNQNTLRTTLIDMYMKGYMQQRNRGQGSGQNNSSSDQQAIYSGGINSRNSEYSASYNDSANRYREQLREKGKEMFPKEHEARINRGQYSGNNRSSSDQQAIASGGINSRDSTERSYNKKDRLQDLIESASDGNILQSVLQMGGLERDPKVAGQTIGKRFPKGQLLSDRELRAINILSRSQEGNRWLEAAGMYNINQAKQYLTAHDYHDWLKLEPANRVLLAHLAWRRPNVVALKNEQVEGTPPYRLGRSMDAKDKNINPERQKEYEEAIDRDLRQEWIKTLKGKELNEDARKAIKDDGRVRKEGKKKGSPLSLSEVEQQHPRATEILETVLILLQAGLEVYDKWRGEHADYEGSVIRALSHGGRVNVRIPALKNKKENPYALTDWLGITESKNVEESGAVFNRPFGTHHMAIGKNINRQPGTGKFREEGGSKAALKNIGNTKLYGMNLAVGGIGERDFNGEVILPDGAHGHMFIGFKPPTIDRDGALQIGIETTAPGGASTVGYHHGPKSSEATANPESSFGGLKADKVGYGSPAKAALIKDKKLDDTTTNARMVDLNKIEYDKWLEYLSYVKHLFDLVKKENIEEYYSLLVGNRSQASLEEAIFRLTGESLV